MKSEDTLNRILKTPVQDCISSHNISKYVTGEINSDVKIEMETHINSCSTCSNKIIALKNDKQEFLKQNGFNTFYKNLNIELENESKKQVTSINIIFNRLKNFFTINYYKPIIAITFSVLLLVLIYPVILNKNKQDNTRIKGSVRIEYYVKTFDKIKKGESGSILYQGDAIQFKYASGMNNYIFVFSIDDKASINTYYPFKGEESMSIKTGGNLILEGSIVLDNYKGYERFFALFSDEPVKFSDIQKAVKTAVLENSNILEIEKLPLNCEQSSFWIEKQ